MLTLVTGGTGFVGAHVVRALLDAGSEVRCLVRTHSDLANLEGLPVDLVTGDLRDAESLEVAVAGCEALYHCAADYRLGLRHAEPLLSSNVDGTRALLASARRAGVRRVVYTSSVGALGLPSRGAVADENTPVRDVGGMGPYKRSKYEAERVALQLADGQFEVVVVNPSTPIGELDRKPTPSGQVLLDYLNGRMPAYVATGLNLIDVRDVAQGHLLAFEAGRSGHKYILGHRNVTLKQLLDMLSELSGLPRVRLRLPHAVPHATAMLESVAERWFSRRPRVHLESVRMARSTMWFDASKAVRELGLPQSPVRAALLRAVRFFAREGMVRQPRCTRLLEHLGEGLDEGGAA